MTTNFRKICGILFLAAMTVMSAPSGAWGQNMPEEMGFTDSGQTHEDFDPHKYYNYDNFGGGVSGVVGEAMGVDVKVKGTIVGTATAVGAGVADVGIGAYNGLKWIANLFGADLEYTDTINLSKAYSAGKKAEEKLHVYIRGGKAALEQATTIQKIYESSDGGTYVLNEDGTMEHLTEEGNFSGCEALPSKLYHQRECFFCPLFKVLFVAADSMSTMSFQKLGTAFKSLIGIGLALWIAVQTLSHVSSLTKQDAPKFLGNLIKQSFKFLIAFLLLANSGEIYRLFVNPILQSGLVFGANLLENNVSIAINVSDAPQTNYLSSGLYASLEAFITKIQYEIAFMQSIGSSLLCIGGHKMVGISGKFEFGTGFQMGIQGLLLAGFGLLLSLAFAFYLIDAVVQIGIVGALMPFLIACWPFKITSSYTGKGVQILLNSFFVFAFMGLVISVNLTLISTALTASQEKAQISSDTNSAVSNTYGGLSSIATAINSQNDDALKKLTDISTVGFLILIACCLFGFKLSGKAEELAGKMAGGAISGIGSSIGTMAASATKGAALKTTAPIRQAAWNKTKDLGKAGWNKLFGKDDKNDKDNKNGGDQQSSSTVGSGTQPSARPTVRSTRPSTVGSSRTAATESTSTSKKTPTIGRDNNTNNDAQANKDGDGKNGGGQQSSSGGNSNQNSRSHSGAKSTVGAAPTSTEGSAHTAEVESTENSQKTPPVDRDNDSDSGDGRNGGDSSNGRNDNNRTGTQANRESSQAKRPNRETAPKRSVDPRKAEKRKGTMQETSRGSNKNRKKTIKKKLKMQKKSRQNNRRK